MGVSITVVMATAIALAAVIGVLVAFIPTYNSGVSGIEDTVTMLRSNVVDRVNKGTRYFFRGAETSINMLQMDYERGIAQGAGTPAQILRGLCEQMRLNNGINTIQMLFPDPAYSQHGYTCDKRFGFYQAGEYDVAAATLPLYDWDENAGTFKRDKDGNKKLRLTLDLNISAWVYGLDVTKALQPTEQQWYQAFPGYNSLQLSTATLARDGFGTVGYISYDVLPDSVGNLLSSLGLGKRARAVAWDPHTTAMLGNSWGEPTQALTANWADLSGVTAHWDRMLAKTPRNISDTLIPSVIASLGGETAFWAIQDPHFSTTIGSGKDKVYVDLLRITDSNKLDVRVLVAMPEIDFMEDVYKQRDITIAVVCVCVVVLIAGAIVFALLLARPLHALGDRMYKTASLQDDDEDDASSILNEIHDMQDAYVTMKAELNRLKGYLPQSVLYGGMDDEEDEDEDEGSMSEATKENGSTQKSEGRASRTSRSSRSSRASHQFVAKNGTAHSGLNVSKSVNSKRCVVMVFNMCGFLEKLQNSGRATTSLPDLQSKYLTIINKHVRENKGVVDLFQGDHVVCSFNAVSNVASSAKRSSLTAFAAVQELSHIPELPPVSVGISGGIAFVGNMGTSDIQRFNIVGPLYTEALMMEKFASQSLQSDKEKSGAPSKPWKIYCHGRLLQDLSLEFLFQVVDIAKFPSGANAAVLSMEQPKMMMSDEWMYQLQEGENSDPFLRINEAFLMLLNALAEGHGVAEVKNFVQGLDAPSNIALAGKDRLQELCEDPANVKKISFVV